MAPTADDGEGGDDAVDDERGDGVGGEADGGHRAGADEAHDGGLRGDAPPEGHHRGGVDGRHEQQHRGELARGEGQEADGEDLVAVGQRRVEDPGAAQQVVVHAVVREGDEDQRQRDLEALAPHLGEQGGQGDPGRARRSGR